MKAKWREQMKREQVSGKTPKLNKLHTNIVGDNDFSYSDISSMSAFRIIDANPPLDVKEYWRNI
jgi:phage-related protein